MAKENRYSDDLFISAYIAKRIWQRAEKAGIPSKRQFALKIKKTPPHIMNVLDGRVVGADSLLENLAEAACMSTDEFEALKIEAKMAEIQHSHGSQPDATIRNPDTAFDFALKAKWGLSDAAIQDVRNFAEYIKSKHG